MAGDVAARSSLLLPGMPFALAGALYPATVATTAMTVAMHFVFNITVPIADFI
jgi:hypothetical protein